MKNSSAKSYLIWGATFIIAFILIFSLLYYQGLSEEIIEEQKEKNYQTISISEISQNTNIEKYGTITSSQDIVVTSQANGKVSKIYSKEGLEVKNGSVVVVLSDTIANYDLQLQKAKNTLDKTILNKQQSELSLDQQISAAENAYKSAQQAYNYAEQMSGINVKQAELGITTADNQIETLKNQFLLLKNSLLNNMDSLLDYSDSLLGVTPYYEDLLWGKQYYVGADNLQTKINAEKSLKALYSGRDVIRELPDIPENIEILQESINKLDEGYKGCLDLTDIMIDLMRGSISTSSNGVLPQSSIDEYIQKFQGYHATLTQARSNVTTYSSQVNSQANNSSTLAQEQADLTYENAVATTENSIINSQIAMDNAKLNYETLVGNKDIQLGLLDNTIKEAQIAYDAALDQYNKLTIKSPIDGIIGDILVVEGQEIGVGTQVFKVSGNSKQEIEVSITSDEYFYIQQNTPVIVNYQSKDLTGQIIAISTIADKTNLYKVIIQLNEDIPLLGDVVKVHFPIELQKDSLIPLKLIKVVNDNEGEISIFNGTEVENLTVKIKKIWGDFVELKEPLSEDIQLVIN